MLSISGYRVITPISASTTAIQINIMAWRQSTITLRNEGQSVCLSPVAKPNTTMNLGTVPTKEVQALALCRGYLYWECQPGDVWHLRLDTRYWIPIVFCTCPCYNDDSVNILKMYPSPDRRLAASALDSFSSSPSIIVHPMVLDTPME